MLIIGLSTRDFLLATLYFLCERCHHEGAHRLVKRVRRFSLFFIPLFSVGTRYLETCTVCGRTIEVPRDMAEQAAAGAQA